MQPVPLGVPGELYLASVGLAQGYLHRPDLTAERFVPHPFSHSSGQRLYRTGDRCRWLADGQITYLGRLDTQVKVRGHRIELEEIEFHVTRHPLAQMAAVRVDGSQIVAYIVCSPVAQVRSEDMATYLKQRLPTYMLPTRYVLVPDLPVTTTGKIDRRALADLTALEQAPAGYVAPRNIVEQRLAAIWEDVLGIAPISVDANFFALGGHSLLATQIIVRVLEHFQVEMPLHTIFEEPTLAGFAQQLEILLAQQHVETAAEDIPLARGARYHGLGE
jgi:acyl carrier protein